jgi:hypothetical protein
MKAIQVRFLPATNFKPARMKAFCENNVSITVPYQYELSSDNLRILECANEFINRLKWEVKITGTGQLKNGDWVVTIS